MDIAMIETRASESMDWKPVFATNLNISESYAMQYMDINAEIGWIKFRIIYVDGHVS